MPSAIFSFTLYIIKVLVLPMVGRTVDTTDRLKLVRASTFGQNSCVCVSVLLLALLGRRVEQSGASFAGSTVDTVLFFVLIIIGIVGDLFTAAGSIGVEKDWVVIIAGNDGDLLSSLNVTLRRIDLFCKIVAPLTFGMVTASMEDPYDQLQLGVSIVFAWSFLTTGPVFFAWRSVYFEYPGLQEDKPPKAFSNPLKVLVQGTVAYLKHPTFGASFAYCCLYFTVLSDHHPLTTAFLKIDGVSNALLGASRGAGAFAGILGTFLFPPLRRMLGVVPTNMIAAWFFVVCIDPISLLYLPSYTGGLLFRAEAMLGVIVVSRIFLWCFDLSNVQIMQETVEENVRGEMNATQTATCQFMELLMATLALFCSSNFHVLVFSSALGVTMAAIVLTIWALRKRRARGPLVQPVLNAA